VSFGFFLPINSRSKRTWVFFSHFFSLFFLSRSPSRARPHTAAGYLLKEGALFASKRFFVLAPAERKLYYAKDDSTDAALGAFDLSAGVSVDVSTAKANRFAFRLRSAVPPTAAAAARHSPRFTPLVTLVAPDVGTRDDWMLALSAVIASAAPASSSDDSAVEAVRPNSARGDRSAVDQARVAATSSARPRPQSQTFTAQQLSSAGVLDTAEPFTRSAKKNRSYIVKKSSPDSMFATSATAAVAAASAGAEMHSASVSEDDDDDGGGSGDAGATPSKSQLLAVAQRSPRPKAAKAKRIAKAKTLNVFIKSTHANADDGMTDVLTPRGDADESDAGAAGVGVAGAPPKGASAPNLHVPTPLQISSQTLTSLPARPQSTAPPPPEGGSRSRASTTVASVAVVATPPPKTDARSLRIALAKKELLDEIAAERAAASPPSPSPPPLTTATTPSSGSMLSGSPARRLTKETSANSLKTSGGRNVSLHNSPVTQPAATVVDESPSDKAKRERGLELQKRMFQAVVSESKGRKLVTDGGKVIFDPDDDSQVSSSPAPPRRAAPSTTTEPAQRRRSSSFNAPPTFKWPSMSLEDNNAAAPPVAAAATSLSSSAQAQAMELGGASSDSSDNSEVDLTHVEPVLSSVQLARRPLVRHDSMPRDAPPQRDITPRSNGSDSEDDEPPKPRASAPVDDVTIASPRKPSAAPSPLSKSATAVVSSPAAAGVGVLSPRKPPPPTSPPTTPLPPPSPKPTATSSSPVKPSPLSASGRAKAAGAASAPPLPRTPEPAPRATVMSASGKVSSLVAKFSNSPAAPPPPE